MNVSKAIRDGLVSADISLTEFARRVGVSVSTAHGWKTGTHGVRMEHLPKIAQAFGCDVAELVA